MKEIREEAERHRKAKLERYGADEKACGGHIKRAHGGKVEHSDEKEDEKLLHKDLKPSAFKHRADGGPIAGGGPSPRLGRGRKGGKGKTNIAINVGKPGGDGPVGLPPALGAGPGPGGPAPMPPKPMPAMPPRPMPAPGGAPAGPGLKHGGKAEHEKHGKRHEHEKKHERHHERKEHEHREHKSHGHSGHRH